MCSIVVKQSYTFQSVPPNISSTHLAPHTVITISLTVFPVLYFTPHDYFVTTNLYFSVPSPFSPSPPTPPLGQPSAYSRCLWVCFCFVCLYGSLDSTCKWNLSFSDWFIWLSVTLSRSTHTIGNGKIAFCSFLQLHSIPFVSVLQIFYSLICWWALGLLPNLGNCK